MSFLLGLAHQTFGNRAQSISSLSINFDWVLMELNRTHPKLLPIKRNRTLQQSNIKPLSIHLVSNKALPSNKLCIGFNFKHEFTILVSIRSLQCKIAYCFPFLVARVFGPETFHLVLNLTNKKSRQVSDLIGSCCSCKVVWHSILEI